MSLLARLVALSLPLVPRFIVRRIASRYVAGATLEEGLDTVARLNRHGCSATLALLGEDVLDRDRTEAAVVEYERALALISERGLDANVSIKLTLMGLKIDEGLTSAHLERVSAAARRHHNFVRIDMEDHTCVDATLRLYAELLPRFPNLGIVLQAYLRRTLADIGRLPASGANVRLCKGIYVEPRAIAYRDYETIRLNFIAALDSLLRRGAYVAVATHDEYLVGAALTAVDRHRLAADRYELQMLLGVDAELRDILVSAGHRLRVYVPYGQDWYDYSVRRLRENPQIALHVLRALLGR
jgi:proline dehydrogenase